MRRIEFLGRGGASGIGFPRVKKEELPIFWNLEGVKDAPGSQLQGKGREIEPLRASKGRAALQSRKPGQKEGAGAGGSRLGKRRSETCPSFRWEVKERDRRRPSRQRGGVGVLGSPIGERKAGTEAG